MQQDQQDQSFSFSLLNTAPDDALPLDGLAGNGLDYDLAGGFNMWMTDIYSTDWSL